MQKYKLFPNQTKIKKRSPSGSSYVGVKEQHGWNLFQLDWDKLTARYLSYFFIFGEYYTYAPTDDTELLMVAGLVENMTSAKYTPQSRDSYSCDN